MDWGRRIMSAALLPGRVVARGSDRLEAWSADGATLWHHCLPSAPQPDRLRCWGALAAAPDGETFAVGVTDHRFGGAHVMEHAVEIRRGHDGSLVRTLPIPIGEVACLAWSAADTIYAASHSGDIAAVHATGGTPMVLPSTGSSVRVLRPVGENLWAVPDGGPAMLWNPASGAADRQLKLPSATALDVGPDGIVAVGSSTGKLALFDAADKKRRGWPAFQELGPFHDRYVAELRFDVSGRSLWGYLPDGARLVRVEVATGRVAAEIALGERAPAKLVRVTRMDIANDGSRVVLFGGAHALVADLAGDEVVSVRPIPWAPTP